VLGLGPSQIKIFFIIFHHFLRISPIPVKFRVDRMIYVGISNHKKNIGEKKLNDGQNQNGRQT
jgi:hypothetical protein